MISIKKTLSVIAILSLVFSPVTPAFAASYLLGGDATWASAGDRTQADVTHAAANDDVDVDTHTLYVTNDGTASDTLGVTNTFTLGSISDTNTGAADTGTVDVRTGSANDLVVNIAAVHVEGAFDVQGQNAHDANVTVTVGSLDADTSVSVLSLESTVAKDVDLTVTGNFATAGGVTVTANTGGGAGANSTLTIGGATVNLGLGLTLNDNTGLATITFDGGAAQTVTGIMDGSAAHEGTLNVDGTAGTVFNNNIGGTNDLLAVNITAPAATTAEFNGTVDADTITMSGAGKAQFDGVVNGTAIGPRNMTLSSAGEVELNADGNVFGTITISGAGTLDANGSLSCTVTNFTADGTIDLAGGKNFGGAVNNTSGADGVGTLNVAGTSTISGNVGATNNLKLITGGAVGSKATFSGTVGADALTVNGTGEVEIAGASTIDVATLSAAGTLDLDGTLTGAVAFGADGLVELADNANISSTVDNTTGADGAGTLTLEGTSTVTGNVGATNSLKQINAGANGEVATFSGTVAATDLKVTGTGTVALDGNTTSNIDFDGNGTLEIDDGVNVTGTIVNSTDSFGTLTFLGASTTGGNIGVAGTGDLLAVNIGDGATGGIVTLAHNIAAVTTTVNTGATLYANGNRTITGDLAVANAASATVSLDTNTLTVTGTYTMLAAGQINLDLNSDTLALGNIAATGIATIPGTVGVDVDVLGTGYITDGQTFNAVTGGAGGAVAGGNTVTDDNPYVSFTTTGGDNLVLVASRSGTGFNNFTTTGNATAAAQSLEAAGKAGATGDMKNVLDTLESLPTSGIQSAVSTMTPDVSSGAMTASQQAATQFLGSVSNRLGYARDGMTGLSTGDMLQGTGFWIQGLGSNLNQGTRKGIEGYSANLFGTTIGADRLVDEHFRVGLAGGYGFADVNSKTPGSPQDDINSWSAIVYGSYDSTNLCQARHSKKNSRLAVRNQLKDNWYVDGMFGFTQYDYDSRREIWLTPATKRVAKADHYGQGYTTKMEGGYTFVFEATKNLETTPFASLQYNYLRMNKYKEHGADALNLTVNGEGYNQLLQTLGTKFAYPIVSKKAGTFIPVLKCAWLFDYIADRFETNASFAGGGTSFETRGAKPARNGLLIGTELGYLNKGNMTLTANYDLELKDEFVGNTYYATARFDF